MTRKKSTTSSEEKAEKPKKKINGAKKGKTFEREIANLIGHIFPEAARHLEYQASRVIGADLDGTDRFLFQLKNHQNYCSIGTIREVHKQNETDIPVLVTKGNRMEAMAVLPFRDFVTLLEVVYGLSSRWEVAASQQHIQTSLTGKKVEAVEYLEHDEVVFVEESGNKKLLHLVEHNSYSIDDLI
jgi:hypothetical protein